MAERTHMTYHAAAADAPWRRYLELTKPRIVALMLFTAVVGMVLSTPYPVPWERALFALLGIGLAAAAGAVMNHVADSHIDGMMRRTQGRPLPTGDVERAGAIAFALLLAATGMAVMVAWVNTLSALLTFFAMIGYALFYTLLLKRTTPQNVVWGGAAGAAPPVLGAAAVAGEVTVQSLLLFVIIFIWTPPHFWPLALHRAEEYRQADLPMLPVTHGFEFTKSQIVSYTVLLFAVTLLPFALREAGWIYLAGALVLGLGFIRHAIRLQQGAGAEHAMATFRYSIQYLFALFALLILDHFSNAV